MAFWVDVTNEIREAVENYEPPAKGPNQMALEALVLEHFPKATFGGPPGWLWANICAFASVPAEDLTDLLEKLPKGTWVRGIFHCDEYAKAHRDFQGLQLGIPYTEEPV